jgi:hypothetical protein
LIGFIILLKPIPLIDFNYSAWSKAFTPVGGMECFILVRLENTPKIILLSYWHLHVSL